MVSRLTSCTRGVLWALSCVQAAHGPILVLALASAVVHFPVCDALAEVVAISPPGTLVSVRYVAVDRNRPGTVYAASYDPVNPNRRYPGGAIFKSTDGGATWVDVGPNLPQAATFEALAIDEHSAIYTCSSGDWGLYRSVDDGATWQRLSDLFVLGLTPDRSSPGTIYGYGYGVLRSTDGGTTWLDASSGLGEAIPGEYDRPGVAAFAIDPQNSSTLYVGRWEKGLYKSTDSGMHWNTLNMGLSPSGIVAIAVDPGNSAVVFAGTAEDGLFKSSDGGSHWSRVDTGQPNPQFFALAFDKDSTLFAGVYDHGVRVSRDGGATWADATPALPSNYIITLVADPGRTGTVYVGSIQ